jgi:hypothetical protein
MSCLPVFARSALEVTTFSPFSLADPFGSSAGGAHGAVSGGIQGRTVGSVGLAIARSGQDLIKNPLAGTTTILEDRSAVRDQVTIAVGGSELNGTINLMGPAPIRLRTETGATLHAGHSAIDSATNYSPLAASAKIAIPTTRWNSVEDDAARRLSTASNDVGATGVVFLPALATQEHPADVTTVTIRSNRPLSADQQQLVRKRLRSETS